MKKLLSLIAGVMLAVGAAFAIAEENSKSNIVPAYAYTEAGLVRMDIRLTGDFSKYDFKFCHLNPNGLDAVCFQEVERKIQTWDDGTKHPIIVYSPLIILNNKSAL